MKVLASVAASTVATRAAQVVGDGVDQADVAAARPAAHRQVLAAGVVVFLHGAGAAAPFEVRAHVDRGGRALDRPHPRAVAIVLVC